MRKSRKNKVKYFIYLLFLLLIAVGFILVLPQKIKITEINCRSQFGQCPNQINDTLNSVLGKDLKSSKREIKTLLTENLYVEKYTIYFRIPNKIEVNIIIRKPYFGVKTEDDDYYLISKDGLVISKSEFSNLPFIEIGENLKVGDKLKESQIFSLKLVSDIFSLYKIDFASIEKDSLVVMLSSGTTVYFPLQGDYKVLVGAMRMIIEQLNSGRENFRIEKALSEISIDLRYKNPILR
jgi:cell division septal protein FtsQ